MCFLIQAKILRTQAPRNWSEIFAFKGVNSIWSLKFVGVQLNYKGKCINHCFLCSGEMDSASHATLLAQVRKLEEALSSIRADLQGVTGCKGRCEQLDSLHDTVSHTCRLLSFYHVVHVMWPDGIVCNNSISF